jgi:hypothetical protein
MLADEYGFRYASNNPAAVSHLGDRWATPDEEVRIAPRRSSSTPRS